ncbi:MAG TPA: STAS domain-containing protein [Aestuariivirga sp.]|nr:STAS domain-containing protein [Aestuariivirga sp.]
MGTHGQGLSVWLETGQADGIRVVIGGSARDGQLEPLVAAFRQAVQAKQNITLDLRGLEYFGIGFAGQLLMLEKAVVKGSRRLTIGGAISPVRRALEWCGLNHLNG